MKLAELYGVTVNELIGDDTTELAAAPKKMPKGIKVLIMLLCSGLVWLVATVVFVTLNAVFPDKAAWWMAFLYAVPVNAVVIIVLSAVWNYRIVNFTSVSVLIWVVLVCIYVTLCSVLKTHISDISSRLWPIFLIGIPLQTLEVLWGVFRWSLFKSKNGKPKEEPKKTEEIK
jgi:hypothetical protein